jgi:hypothetical protein
MCNHVAAMSRETKKKKGHIGNRCMKLQTISENSTAHYKRKTERQNKPPSPSQKKHGAKRFRKKGFGLLLWLFLITQKEESGRILPGI